MTASGEPSPVPWSSLRLTAGSVKVLAHPLRSRLLSSLRTDGPATATTLAAALGTNTGATSYHLRKLAQVGLVEDTGEGRGRERWWRPTTQMHDWDDTVYEGDGDAHAAAGWLREHYVRMFVDKAEHWLAHHDGWPLEWRRLFGSSDYLLDLTAPQLEALMNELWDVMARHAELASGAAPEPAAPDATGPARQRVLLYIHDFPEGERPR